MKNSPKFDIKVSFTGQSIKANKKNLQNYLFERLINKKINIHLKIDLDKLEYQYKREKLLRQKNNLKSEFEKRININDMIDEESQDLFSEEAYKNTRKKQSPPISFNTRIFNKNSRSFSGQKTKNNLFKNTLVLDLDETLVYVSDTKNNYSVIPQIKFDYYVLDESEKYIKENMSKLGINKVKKSVGYLVVRPGCNLFLNLLKKFYNEIVVFTSSQYSYAEEIIKIIDKNKIISKIYSRKDCSFFDDVFYKDLNKINDDLSHTIIIDNYPECYLLQHFNGLPIPSFTGNPKDKELLKLIPLLERLSKVKDVRNYIRQIILFNEQNINYNKAYQLLNIKGENFFHQINNNLIRNKNKKNNY
jgi:Dullard-like phosphatase family protein